VAAGLWGTGSGSTISSDNGLPEPRLLVLWNRTKTFYQFLTGANSDAQGLTCTNTQDAFMAYQVAMLPGPA
jgi:hypothetical protein